MTNFVAAVGRLTVRGKRRKLPQNFGEKAQKVRRALMRNMPLTQENKLRTEFQVYDVAEFSVKEHLKGLQSCDFCSGDWAPWSKIFKLSNK